MSIITEYTEKINKLYNDSTLSKDQRTELVRDILGELKTEFFECERDTYKWEVNQIIKRGFELKTL